MDSGRSIRSVKNNMPAPSGDVEESESPRWTHVRRNGPGAAKKYNVPVSWLKQRSHKEIGLDSWHTFQKHFSRQRKQN